MRLAGLLQESLKRFVSKGVRGIARSADDAVRNRRNVDAVLAAHLRGSDLLLKLSDPVRYVDFLTSCFEQTKFSVHVIKDSTSAYHDAAEKRWQTLLAVLQDEVPPIDFKIAQDIGLIADGYASLLRPMVLDGWAGDVGLNFSISSSFGRKGRLLSTIIRLARSLRCLEVGTAYGMSANFILAALRANGDGGHLTTLEGSEEIFALASPVLSKHYGEMVRCCCGLSQESLPQIVMAMEGIDFVFHDAAHSREDYIRDFNIACTRLVSGAIVLFDDIRWEDTRWNREAPHTYEGWLEIVAHPRVTRAVEIDYGRLGLLMVR